MSSSFDLHTHSNASDGYFSAAELVKKAKEAGIKTLALTDHDTVAGLKQAKQSADKFGVNFINGIELSCQWNNKPIHIVGLNINPTSRIILDSIKLLEEIREERAIRIGEKLAKAGIVDAYKNAKRFAGNGTVTRSHFAQYIIESGHAKDQTDVFKRFLVRNKPGYAKVDWPSLEETINTINGAGGVAIIAHPMRYKVTATKLRKMIADFKLMGGKAIEVVTGNNNPEEIRTTASYAKKYDIAASVGSDFHNEQTPWNQLGKLKPLPKDLRPVWELW
ncbi:MAG: PHP domain-containing protein [Proteobacteria bacterium]|nr:PHP domain-containing protein [Pseudomonadota bacterium]